jgi:protocatechuate 3,4-dioxygenase beta subunit
VYEDPHSDLLRDTPIAALTRRTFLRLSLALPTAFLSVAGGLGLLLPTPACADDDEHEPTPRRTEGPFYVPDSPRRNVLVEEGMRGTRLLLRGRVLSTHGRPIPGALLDFWQADIDGEYDLAGFRLRGHQLGDAQGRYALRTIVPAPYSFRAPHIHVRVQAPGGRALPTQLFFPNHPRNRTDGIFRDSLVMAVRDTANGKEALFDFILAVR